MMPGRGTKAFVVGAEFVINVAVPFDRRDEDVVVFGGDADGVGRGTPQKKQTSSCVYITYLGASC